ncbi:GtrA-like protein [Roseovarius sp. THAF9]|uniref:GtrA family protein n=1 Tax=Roseovarius sp. THAF9 TaxID=2587847 RepID=UPI0012679425|nr:GtrA family protein [Roseovarius sp. THAF9]QFT93662.1 GtrA-like protein [Roseovarius sp. THAF9]
MTCLANSFPRFLAVGSIGFVVDAGVLWVLVTLGGDAYLSRGLSFAMAMSVTWALNRRWTFRGARRTALHREYAAYALVQGIGTAINFAVYALMLALLGTGPTAAVVALACGSSVALAVNYIGLKHAVFRPAAPQDA